MATYGLRDSPFGQDLRRSWAEWLDWLAICQRNEACCTQRDGMNVRAHGFLGCECEIRWCTTVKKDWFWLRRGRK